MATMLKKLLFVAALAAALLVPLAGQARILGHEDLNQTVSLTLVAGSGRLSTPDGFDYPFWGFADGAAAVQYPGPTFIVNEGAQVTVTLINNLPEPVSLIFPGMEMTSATNPIFAAGSRRQLSSLAPEAAPNGGKQTYTFTATRAGTYFYQTATNQPVQVRMGLFGALIVRPPLATQIVNVTIPDYLTCPPVGHAEGTDGVNFITSAAPCTKTFRRAAYTPADNADATKSYDREFLFLASEMDPALNNWVDFEQNKKANPYDFSTWRANYWFINGRSAPDTLSAAYDAGAGTGLNFPSQPYNAMPQMHPGERVLGRLIDMGSDFHPFHVHGNHGQIASDGNVLSSQPQPARADLAWLSFTFTMAPGKTVDFIYTWSGKDLGWDMYGHQPADGVATQPYEFIADHDKVFNVNLVSNLAGVGLTIPQALPVIEPNNNELTAGMWWSGGPYLGSSIPLPPGEGGLNPLNGYFYMWHSHAERELTNNNIFPGGFLTFMGIIPWPAGSTDNIVE